MQKKYKTRQIVVRLLSIATDLLTIAVVFRLNVLARTAMGGTLDPNGYIKLWPFLIIVWLVFEKMGLYKGTSIYSGSSIGPVEEIRRLVYALCGIFVALGFSNYCYRPDNYLYSRSVLIATCLICMFLIPVNRIILRKILSRLNCWGVPAIIIGSGQTARQVFNDIQKHPEYGLIPVGFFTDSPSSNMPEHALHLGNICDIEERTAQSAIKYAILAKDESLHTPHIQQIISLYGVRFPHLLVVLPSLLNTCSGVIPKDIGGTFGLEIRHNLQIPSIYRTKRAIDYALTLPVLLATLPLIGLLAALVKLDSSGPAFFKHRRVTKNGRQIHIYKFRTMVKDADSKLNEILRDNPDLKREWQTRGKLENDPRITRIGKWLRKTSLDELPQLLNVLQGKLTLVGPRPLVKMELEIYGEAASLFDRVLPGLTGLWQVSGRNELTYVERAKLDLYYVNNWSVWLDIYILAKTVYAVIFRYGAK